VLNIKTTVHPSFCLWQDEEQLTVNKELDGPLIQLNSWMVATANILMIQDNARSHYAFVLISTLEWHLVQVKNMQFQSHMSRNAVHKRTQTLSFKHTLT